MLVYPTLFLPRVPSSFRNCRSSSSSSERSSAADDVVVVAHSSSILLMCVLLHHLNFARSSSILLWCVLLHHLNFVRSSSILLLCVLLHHLNFACSSSLLVLLHRVGEVSIALDDVAYLLHLSIVGDFLAFQPLHIDEAVLICQTQHWTTAARAYLLHLLGFTFFANKSATHVHVVFLDALLDLTQTRRYAWGASGLVHLYDQLNDASISTRRQVVGYITLLQCWTYEQFSSVAEYNADSEYDEVSPHAC
ncbi:Protein MAIN-LIKE 1 [Glycine max]|nr:Protein MAIN-LIKE 1 [Glycine max]